MLRNVNQKIVYFVMIIDCKVLTTAHKLAANKYGVNEQTV